MGAFSFTYDCDGNVIMYDVFEEDGDLMDDGICLDMDLMSLDDGQ